MLDGDLRVFARDDALDEQLDGHGIAQPFHELPIHIRGMSRSYL
jgi:hypothetical protein